MFDDVKSYRKKIEQGKRDHKDQGSGGQAAGNPKQGSQGRFH